MGIWNAHTSLGNIFGGLIGAAFVDTNWAYTFIVPGAIIAGMGVIVYFLLFPCKLPLTTVAICVSNLLFLLLLCGLYQNMLHAIVSV